MIVISGKAAVSVEWSGRIDGLVPTPGFQRLWTVGDGGFYAAAYDLLYRRHIWVGSAVDKLGKAEARLPLKVFERGDENMDRREVRDDPYAQLLRKPHPALDPFSFWRWWSNTYDVYGEAFLRKIRNRPRGVVVWLKPMHPTRVEKRATSEGDLMYRWYRLDGTFEDLGPEDVIPRLYWHPTSGIDGLSPLERLRSTLHHEWSAMTATSSFWEEGARPSIVLQHPKSLGDKARINLREGVARFQGAKNWGGSLLLEEGTTATPITLNSEEAQYIDSRRLNREEVCGAFDIPPPVLHILDRATFSNITEQMRSMYRDTMAPRIVHLQSILEHHLRPDFDPDGGIYAEYLVEEVLRADFETRATAEQAAINSGTMTPAEVRKERNRPFIEGSDRLLINSTLVPLARDQQAAGDPAAAVKAKADALGILIRSGVKPEVAALIVGLEGVEFTGAVPVSLRLPEEDAVDLEGSPSGAGKSTDAELALELKRLGLWPEQPVTFGPAGPREWRAWFGRVGRKSGPVDGADLEKTLADAPAGLAATVRAEVGLGGTWEELRALCAPYTKG